MPAPALWAYLSNRHSRSTLLLVALLIQVVGIALPSLSAGIAPALISAVLFGNTFIAIAALSIAIGAHLQFPRSVALLTAGYSIGQILGPLVVKPLLPDGYHDALLVGAGIVAAAAVAAAALRVRFPHRVGAVLEPREMARPS
jgi:MFS family permease